MTDIWETREIERWLVNDEFAYGEYRHYTPQQLRDAFYEEAANLPIHGVISQVFYSFLQQALAQVDWDEVAATLTADETECEDCTNSFTDEDDAKSENWRDDNGIWYCLECRDDYGTCEGCYDRLPAEDLDDDDLCTFCLRREEEKQSIQVGDFVDIPGNAEIGTYDYGQVMSLVDDKAGVMWFKWGVVPFVHQTGMNCVFDTHLVSELTKVDTKITYYQECVLYRQSDDSYPLVKPGDTVYQVNNKKTGTLIEIFGSLKKRHYWYLLVDVNGKPEIWHKTNCQATAVHVCAFCKQEEVLHEGNYCSTRCYAEGTHKEQKGDD
jgi:hypothetical protein